MNLISLGWIAWILLAVLLTCCISDSMLYAADHKLVVGNFSKTPLSSELPQGWENLFLKKVERNTQYDLVNDNGTVVVRAKSQAAASSLIRKIEINPIEFPHLTWKWKITKILEKGNAHNKKTEDFPARIYVTFEYDPKSLSLLDRVKYEAARLIYGTYPPLCAITYVWGNRTEKGTVIPSPYSDKALLVVVESGKEMVNQWVTVSRNIYNDYRAAFGGDPPTISGIAIMTDTDNTGETVTAYYGDIVFSKSRDTSSRVKGARQ